MGDLPDADLSYELQRPRSMQTHRHLQKRISPGSSLSRPASAPKTTFLSRPPSASPTACPPSHFPSTSSRLAKGLRLQVQVAKPDASRTWSDRHHVPIGLHNPFVNPAKRAYFDKTPQLLKNEELSDKELMYYGLKKSLRQRQKTSAEAVKSENGTGARETEQDLDRLRYKTNETVSSAADESVSSDNAGSDSKRKLPGSPQSGARSRTGSEDAQQGPETDLKSSPRNKKMPLRKKSTLRRLETTFLVEASESQHVKDFYEWLVEKFGNLTRGWRMLDQSLNMKLSLLEFLKGCQQFKFTGNARAVFKELDRDDSGNILYYHFDPSGALELAQITAWCEGLGGVQQTFRKLDKDRNGKLSPEEFIRGARRLGLNSNDSVSMLFHMLDLDKSKTLTREELSFVDEWPCPPFLKAEPDFKGRSEFKMALFRAFKGNGIVAWRVGIDRDGSMRVNYHEFFKSIMKIKKMHVYKDRFPAIFRAFDGNLSGWLSLREFDPDSYRLLLMFKNYCDETFGTVSHAFACLDIDKNQQMNKREFLGIVFDLQLTQEEKDTLFDGLDLDFRGAIKPSEFRYLDHWDVNKEKVEEEKWKTFSALARGFQDLGPGGKSGRNYALQRMKSDLKVKMNSADALQDPWLQPGLTESPSHSSDSSPIPNRVPDEELENEFHMNRESSSPGGSTDRVALASGGSPAQRPSLIKRTSTLDVVDEEIGKMNDTTDAL